MVWDIQVLTGSGNDLLKVRCQAIDQTHAVILRNWTLTNILWNLNQIQNNLSDENTFIICKILTILFVLISIHVSQKGHVEDTSLDVNIFLF